MSIFATLWYHHLQLAGVGFGRLGDTEQWVVRDVYPSSDPEQLTSGTMAWDEPFYRCVVAPIVQHFFLLYLVEGNEAICVFYSLHHLLSFPKS